MAGEEDFTLLGIAFVIIGLRMYVRFTQVRMANWQLDDYLMPLIGVSPLPTYLPTYSTAFRKGH